MDQASAKKLIEKTNYLDDQILVYKEKSKTIFGKIIWKGYSAAAKDEQGNDGTVRVRIKDLYNRNEFSESLSKIANKFPKEFITKRINSKQEILNVLENNKDVESKTLSWIEGSVSIPEAKKLEDIENLMTELWLESKVTKARFKASEDVIYNPRS